MPRPRRPPLLRAAGGGEPHNAFLGLCNATRFCPRGCNAEQSLSLLVQNATRYAAAPRGRRGAPRYVELCDVDRGSA